MALGISFADDFSARYDLPGGSSETARKEAEGNYRLNALARADEASAVKTAEDAARRSVFERTKSELSSRNPSGTLAGAALGYAKSVAEMKAAASRGDMETAHRIYETLDTVSGTNASDLIDRASVQGTNNFEAAMQASYQNLAQRSYAAETFSLPGGDVVTFGDFFGSTGDGYKRYQRDSVIRSSFSADVDAAYKSDDPVKAAIMGLVVDPVTEFAASPGTRGAPYPLRLQHREIGDYVARNYDGLVDDLGVEGLRTLVADAVDNRARTGSSPRDFMDAVRKWTVDRVSKGDQSDTRDIVQSLLSTYDRLSRSLTSPDNSSGRLPPQSERLLMKTFTSVVESAAGTVDFSSGETVEAIGQMMGLVNAFDRLRVPLVGSMATGGRDVGAAIASAVVGASTGTGVPESNAFVQYSDALDLASRIMSGGCSAVPPDRSADPTAYAAPSAVLGATSGNRDVDSARKMMASSLLRRMVPFMSRGSNAIDAVAKSASRNEVAELVNDWGDDIRTTLGLRKKTADAVAAAAARSAFGSGNGFVPVDIMSTVRSLVFDDSFKKSSPDGYRDLMRFLKAQDLVAKTYAPEFDALQASLTDPVVGVFHGSPDQARAVVARAMNDAAALAEAGRDPRQMLAARARVGRAFMPTGRYIGPDGGLVDYKTATGRKSADETFIPELTVFTGDLDTLADPGIQGVAAPLPSGSFTGDRASFQQRQLLYREYYKRAANRFGALDRAQPD